MAQEQLRLQRQEDVVPSRIERKVYQPEDEEEQSVPQTGLKGGLVNKLCMYGVAILLDFISFIPGANEVE